MMNILGAKRVFILLGLVLLNALLALSVHTYLGPELQKKEKILRVARAEASVVQSDIGRMEIEMEQFAGQQVRFEQYKEDGFFIGQNRRQVQDLFKLIQEKSGVSVATVAVNPAVVEKNDEAKKADHGILRSTIQIKLEALDDVNIYHYLYLIEKFFPGHVTIERVEFEREAEINGTVLRAISGGKNFPLVNASLELVWRTMVPESQLITKEER